MKNLIWLSILQGWAIFLVVVGHAPLDLTSYGIGHYVEWAHFIHVLIYKFHMPLFIFISGFLYKHCKYEERFTYYQYLKKKITRIAVPFFSITTIVFLIKGLNSSFFNRPVSFTLEEVINAFLNPYLGPMREFWFLMVLFIYFIIAPILNKFIKDKIGKICVVTFALCFAVFPISDEILCYDRALHYLLFFVLGIFYAEVQENLVRIFGALALIIASLILGLCFDTEYLQVCYALIGIFISIWLSLLAQSNYSDIFHTFRKFYYQIFLLGIFFQVFVRIVYNTYAPNSLYLAFFFFSIIIGLYGPVTFSKIILKCSPRFGIFIGFAK